MAANEATSATNNKSSDGGLSAAGFKKSIVKKSINIKIAGGTAAPNATASSSSPNTNQSTTSSNQLTSLQKQQNSLSNKLKQSAAKLKTVESAPELTYKSNPQSTSGPMNQMIGQNNMMNNAYPSQYTGGLPPTGLQSLPSAALLPSIPPPNVGLMPNGPALMPTPQFPPNRMPGNQYGNSAPFNVPPPTHLLMQPHQVYPGNGAPGFNMPPNLVQQGQQPLLFNPYMMMHPNGMNQQQQQQQQRIPGPNNMRQSEQDAEYDEYRMMGDDAYDLDDQEPSYNNKYRKDEYDYNYDLDMDDMDDMLGESKRSKKHHKTHHRSKKHKKHKKSSKESDQEDEMIDDLDGIKSMLKEVLTNHIDMLTKAKDFELIPTLNGLLEQVVNDDSSLTHEDCVSIHQTVKSLFDAEEEGEVEKQEDEAKSRKRKNKDSSSRSRRQKKAKDEMEAGEIDDMYDDQEAIVQKEYYDLLR